MLPFSSLLRSCGPLNFQKVFFYFFIFEYEILGKKKLFVSIIKYDQITQKRPLCAAAYQLVNTLCVAQQALRRCLSVSLCRCNF